MEQMVNPIPEGNNTVTPYLIIKDAARAMEFYQDAFNASTHICLNGPEGKVAHCELKIGDSSIMIADEDIQMGCKSPTVFGGSPVAIMLYLPDVDHAFDQALRAGCEEIAPLEDKFYGDRLGSVLDPFGYTWHLASRIEILSIADIEERMQSLYG